MSFLDDISSVGNSVSNFFSENSIASSLVKVAGIALIANELSKNAIKDNNSDTSNIDAGVRLQVAPNTDSKIPVLYGSAFFSGNITDAVMTNTNKTMYYAITLTEKTGTKLSDGLASTYLVEDIYWNDQRIIFKTDGITVDYTVDRDSNIDYSLQSQVSIITYVGGSASPQTPTGYTNTELDNAASYFPGWTTSTHTMNNLIFSVVKVDYNRDKNVTGLGTVKYHLTNSMHKPGDCLYDYMTNTRYGAGIDPTEINT